MSDRDLDWGEVADEVFRCLYEKYGIGFVDSDGIMEFERDAAAIEALQNEIRKAAQYQLALRSLDDIGQLLPEQRVDIFGLIFDEYCGRCGKQRDRECSCLDEGGGT